MSILNFIKENKIQKEEIIISWCLRVEDPKINIVEQGKKGDYLGLFHGVKVYSLAN